MDLRDYKIKFTKGAEPLQSTVYHEVPVLDYNEVNDVLKPDCFNLYVRLSIGDIISTSRDAVSKNINSVLVARDIANSINLELYRPYIMDSKNKDVYHNQAAILLSNLIIESLSYYGIQDIQFFQILEIFSR